MIVEYANALETKVDEKCIRRVLSHSENLMMVEVRFAKGGIGAMHLHTDHEQISYIVKGSLEVTVGDEVKVLRPGDSFYAPKHTLHGVVALEEDSVIIDVFTPRRSDFL